jgi:uncharacterized membrane protein
MISFLFFVRKSLWIELIVFTLLFMVSCSSDHTERKDETSGAGVPGEDPSAVSHAIQVYRGYAVYGHEVRSFRPCGRDEPLWVIEPSGLLWTLHKQLASHQTPYPEVFSVVKAQKVPAPIDGFGADYSATLRIESMLYVGLERPGCDEDWSTFEYRVYGNEPFWLVEVSNSRLRLSRLGSEDQFWHEVAVEKGADGVRYTSFKPSTTPIELTVSRKPCRDSMSGAFYAFTAILRIGNEELEGCALQGQPSNN